MSLDVALEQFTKQTPHKGFPAEWNSQSFVNQSNSQSIAENFCQRMRDRQSAVDSILEKMSNGWSKLPGNHIIFEYALASFRLDRISAVELWKWLQINAKTECLQSRRVVWFGHLERMEESSLPIEYQMFETHGCFAGGKPRKSWNEVERSGLEEQKVSREMAKERNA